MSKIHTVCQGCCFGVYDDVNSTTQLGCCLNLIDYYCKNKNVNIIEGYNECGEFYIIDGMKCYFKRNKKWYNKLEDKKTFIEKVYDETKIKYMAIIVADKDDILDVKVSLHSLIEQKLQPSFIVVITKFNPNIDINELNKILINTGKKWRVSKPSSPQVTSEIITNNLINIFWRKYSVYLKLNCGYVIRSDDMQNFSDEIIYNNLKFALVNIGDNIKIGNSVLHYFFKGNFPQESIKDIDTI